MGSGCPEPAVSGRRSVDSALLPGLERISWFPFTGNRESFGPQVVPVAVNLGHAQQAPDPTIRLGALPTEVACAATKCHSFYRNSGHVRNKILALRAIFGTSFRVAKPLVGSASSRHYRVWIFDVKLKIRHLTHDTR